MLTRPNQLGEGSQDGFDLIYSQLTFHHIEDAVPVMQTLLSYLKPGKGRLMIFDFARGAPGHGEKFHPNHKHEGLPWHGFANGQLKSWLEQSSSDWTQVEERVAFTIEKSVQVEGPDGQTVEGKENFDIILAQATRI